MPNYHYYQRVGGEETWRPIQTELLAQTISQHNPMFVTVLAAAKMAEDLDHAEKITLAYNGPLYFDFDSPDEELVIQKVNQFLDKLAGEREGECALDLNTIRLFATGGRGYHIEIPQKVFMARVPPKGVVALPGIYREMALALAVDTLDLKIYSGGRGRMWRQPNVRRDNGRFKVQITAQEMREMTPEMCRRLTEHPRDLVPPAAPVHLNSELAIMFNKAEKKIEELVKKRKQFKPNPEDAKRANSESVQMAMAGLGLRPDKGFHEIAMQLSCAAVTAGLSSEQFVTDCAGLIASHASDSNRYSTPEKRREELQRMYRYMDGNEYYEFSVGAIKVLLTHTAPDLDGVKIERAELEELAAEGEKSAGLDEYSDVARGLHMEKHGIYKMVDGMKKRICALSFSDVNLLFDCKKNTLVAYDAQVLVSGTAQQRVALELDVYASLMYFNRFAARYGHAFQGSDQDVRTAMMRFVELGKSKGQKIYISIREGLDIVNIAHGAEHNGVPVEALEPFIIWSDNSGVVLPPHLAEAGLKMQFLGYPDPRGVVKTDISKAPALTDWLAEPGNRESLHALLQSLMTCQKPDLLGKLLGWYVACFWKQLFHHAYNKFPLLHVNGPAGVGKTEMNILFNNFFYYQQSARILSPSSTVFAMNQYLSSTASIPIVIDEYKPEEMGRELHGRIKLMLRDAYNQRGSARGGGTRENDDYRQLQEVEMSAPLVFIAEAAETESAVMERVVMATFSRPPQVTGLRWQSRYQAASRNSHFLGILGQWIAGDIVNNWSVNRLRDEFDALYLAAQRKYMLNEEDLTAGLPEDELINKQAAKERSVYNHTVALFGFQQFRKLVNAAVGESLDETMAELESLVFARLSDLNAATTPEYVKVLSEISRMSWSIDGDKAGAVRKNSEYAIIGEKLEIDLRACYTNYRRFCKDSGLDSLYKSAEPFMYATRESPAFIKSGSGTVLQAPGTYTFSMSELAKLGVPAFKDVNK